jgi:RimJ/RimL family protein N-acetyltransferase
MGKITFVRFDEVFLHLSWSWLNDPEIKRLTDTGDFTERDQFKWYDSLSGRTDYKVWGIESDGNKIGVLGLKGISGAGAEYFGYIGEKTCWNKGISKLMLDFICTHAKANGLGLISLSVIKDNERAIRAYKRYGFTLAGENEKMVFMDIKVLGI